MTTGFMARAQAQAATLVRTAIANAVNTARLASFAEEGVQAIEWVSVIDVTFDVGSHSLGVLRAANVPHGARSVFPCDSHVSRPPSSCPCSPARI